MSIECKIFLHITADLTVTSRNLFAFLCLEGKHCISDSTKCASRNSRIHKEKSRQLPCSDRRQYKPFKEKIISIEDVYWVLFRDGKNWITYVRGCPFEKSKLFQAGRVKLQYIMAGKLSYLSKGKNHWFVWRQMTPYQGNAFLFHSPQQLLFELTRRSSTGLNLALHALILKIQRNNTAPRAELFTGSVT